MVEIEFSKIRSYHGDQRQGFEEFICQLARREKNIEAREFRRVEGAGGDGGVECYWVLKDGTEVGYQAKFFLKSADISWAQIDKSVETAIEKHPALVKCIVAVPCDLTDRSGKKGAGRTGWELWGNHKAAWEKRAANLGRSVEFVVWTNSELVDKLVSSVDGRGLALFWFRHQILDRGWFDKQFARTAADLGERFNPQDNVRLGISEVFEGLRRSSAYRRDFSTWFSAIPSAAKFVAQAKNINLAVDDATLARFSRNVEQARAIAAAIMAPGPQAFPIGVWAKQLNDIWTDIDELREFLDVEPAETASDVDRERLRDCRRSLMDISAHLDTHAPLSYGDPGPNRLSIASDMRRAAIVEGEPGAGKSHLLADAAATALSEGAPALLLLGQSFAGHDVRKELLYALDLADHAFEDVLAALNASAELVGQRAMILIDALNEANVLTAWPAQLAGIVNEVLKFEWLSIGFSLRPEYVEPLVPKKVLESALQVRHNGITSLEEQRQAAVQYFVKRGIVRPAAPWLAPEFSNFLFLKTCCDALREIGQTEFPRGLRGSLQVLSFYLQSIESKLRRSFPGSDIPSGASSKIARSLAASMAARGADFVELADARAICELAIGSLGPSAQKAWLSIVASEGLVRRDHLFESSTDPLATPKEVYRFAYQRFSDHLIVEALLGNAEPLQKAFQKGGALAFLIEGARAQRWRSLWEALAVQIPERNPGYEIVDLVANAVTPGLQYTIENAFKQSLLWRSTKSFSARTKGLFEALRGTDKVSILLILATVVDHPWNADTMHETLAKLDMPVRDASWTVQLNAASAERHPAIDLIDWVVNSDVSAAEAETLRLCSIALGWMLGSPNRLLRDSATKALANVFAAQPDLIPTMLATFGTVDDLYVRERICASILGAVTRISDKDAIAAAAVAISETIFAVEPVPLNLNLRDYARAIIQFAASSGCATAAQITASSPPYKSALPTSFPTEDDVKVLAKKAGGDEILHSALTFGDFERYEIEPMISHFTSVLLSNDKPLTRKQKFDEFLNELSDWEPESRTKFLALKTLVNARPFRLPVVLASDEQVEEKQTVEEKKADLAIAVAEQEFVLALQDAQRATYETFAVPVLFPERSKGGWEDLPGFDPKRAKCWVTARAYDLGWNAQRFPRDRSGGADTHNRPSTERIGKKYQWLALSEFVCRLADNVWTVGSWTREAEVYDHPARDWFVRDIDPSFSADWKGKVANNNRWQPPSLNMESVADDELSEWPFSGEPPVDPKALQAIMPDGAPGLLLYSFAARDEDRNKDDVGGLRGRNRQFFLRTSAILVRRKESDLAVDLMTNLRLADPTGHEAQDWIDGPFYCEYPWRNTWAHDLGVWDSGLRNAKGLSYIRPVSRYAWESHLDKTLPEGMSICVLNPWIAQQLDVRPNLDHPGALFSSKQNSVVFLDSFVGRSGSAAIISREAFVTFLQQADLDCIWITAGERAAWPSGIHGKGVFRRSYAGIHRLRGNGWESKFWNEDIKEP